MYNNKDLCVNFRFLMEIGNFKCSFFKASGMASEIEFEEYHEGGSNFSLKFPVKVKHFNVILEKGVTESKFLYGWFDEIQKGIIDKKDFVISVLDTDLKTPIRSWTFINGYPVKWELSDLNAVDKSVLIEKIELTHEGIKEL